MDGVDCCHVGFLMHHMVAHTTCYDRTLTLVTRVFSINKKECSSKERRMYFARQQSSLACQLPVAHLLVGEVAERKEAGHSALEKQERKNVTIVEIEGGHERKMMKEEQEISAFA